MTLYHNELIKIHEIIVNALAKSSKIPQKYEQIILTKETKKNL